MMDELRRVHLRGGPFDGAIRVIPEGDRLLVGIERNGKRFTLTYDKVDAVTDTGLVMFQFRGETTSGD
jgi:hypothetical protein